MPSSNLPVAPFTFHHRGAPFLGRVVHDGEDLGDIEIVPEFLSSIARAWEDPDAYGIDYDEAEAYAAEAVAKAGAA